MARRPTKSLPLPLSREDFEQLGDGILGYIRKITSEEAQERYPDIEKLPKGLTLYALHAADGTPIALTSTRHAALTHAMRDKLDIATVH